MAPKALRLAGAVPLNRMVTISEAKRTEGAAAKIPANLLGDREENDEGSSGQELR